MRRVLACGLCLALAGCGALNDVAAGRSAASARQVCEEWQQQQNRGFDFDTSRLFVEAAQLEGTTATTFIVAIDAGCISECQRTGRDSSCVRLCKNCWSALVEDVYGL